MKIFTIDAKLLATVSYQLFVTNIKILKYVLDTNYLIVDSGEYYHILINLSTIFIHVAFL